MMGSNRLTGLHRGLLPLMRNVIVGLVFLLPWVMTAQFTKPPSSADADPAQIAELVSADHILANLGLLDSYGHVSVRDDRNPNRYLMARAVPAAQVKAEDIVVYDLDSKPLSSNEVDSFWERFIHGEIYKADPTVNSVVHSHSPDVIPFSITNVPLRPVIHVAGFMPHHVKVFDIRSMFGETDMLVETPAMGHALAQALGSDSMILLRGHGVVVTAPNLHKAVFRAYYMTIDARAEQQALLIGHGSIKFLSLSENEKTSGLGGIDRAWNLWKTRVKHSQEDKTSE